MIDIQKLKALAEAATPGPWTAGEEHESAFFQGYCVGDPEGWIAILGTANEDGCNADYIAAANPAAVLELIAEIERLERNRDMWKTQVERQAEELSAMRAEVAEWKDTVKFNEGCWSEERGTMIDKLQSARAENDQLKTENTDLHATLQAAKGEIERLKAENKALLENPGDAL